MAAQSPIGGAREALDYPRNNQIRAKGRCAHTDCFSQHMQIKPGATNEWEFYTDASGQWSWRHVGYERRRDSHVLFSGIVEAMADAVRHGYQPGISHIEMERCRRTEPRRS